MKMGYDRIYQAFNTCMFVLVECLHCFNSCTPGITYGPISSCCMGVTSRSNYDKLQCFLWRLHDVSSICHVLVSIKKWWWAAQKLYFIHKSDPCTFSISTWIMRNQHQNENVAERFLQWLKRPHWSFRPRVASDNPFFWNLKCFTKYLFVLKNISDPPFQFKKIFWSKKK